MPRKKKSLDEFLAATPARRGGLRCAICFGRKGKPIREADEVNQRLTATDGTAVSGPRMARWLRQLGHQISEFQVKRHRQNCLRVYRA